MADYKVTDAELTSIANAIRTKGGTSSQLEFPNGFVSAVQAIPTGGGDVPMLTRAEWTALNPAQKEAYGYVAILDTIDGYLRGKLVYGGEYPGELRTNYAASKFILSNWTVNYDDNFELKFKHINNPSAKNQWPVFLMDERGSADFLVQHNFYGGRKVINFGWHGKWAGDDAVSYETPYDYDNWYIIKKTGDLFEIYKQNVNSAIASITLNGASVDAPLGHTAQLFEGTADKALDLYFYYLKVYDSNGNLIHNYLPNETANNGVTLMDTADNNTIIYQTGNGFTLV